MSAATRVNHYRIVSTQKRDNRNIKFSEIIAASLLSVAGCVLRGTGCHVPPLVYYCTPTFRLSLTFL